MRDRQTLCEQGKSELGKSERRRGRAWLVNWGAAGRETQCLIVGVRSRRGALKAAEREFLAVEATRAILVRRVLLEVGGESGAA